YALLLPSDVPMETAVMFELDEQINAAMESRFELGQQQLRIDSAGIATNVARNNLLPQLNVVGSVGIQGLDSSFESALGNQFDFDHINYSAGLQYEFPIGNRAARAVYQRALLQRQQAIDQYRNLIDQVSLDVKTAMREVSTTWDEMSATRQAFFAEADALRGIQQREDGGEPLTPTFVQLKLDTQGRLAEIARAQQQSIANYNIAIASLEFAKGTLLRYNNILMEENTALLVKK
ncbi:MAG: TolC family protein, partial [Tepidisphaeraceae bacterium]